LEKNTIFGYFFSYECIIIIRAFGQEAMSKDPIITKLQSQVQRDNEEGFLLLYDRLFEKVQAYILRNKGDETEARDIFQESLLVLYKLAKQGRLTEVENTEAYLYTICRNRWLRYAQSRGRTVEITENHYNIPVDEVTITRIIDQERQRMLDRLLQSLGEVCYKILIYFYYEKKSMKEILDLLPFKTEQVIKNKKSNCLKKMRTLLEEYPQFKEMIQ